MHPQQRSPVLDILAGVMTLISAGTAIADRPFDPDYWQTVSDCRFVASVRIVRTERWMDEATGSTFGRDTVRILTVFRGRAETETIHILSEGGPVRDVGSVQLMGFKEADVAAPEMRRGYQGVQVYYTRMIYPEERDRRGVTEPFIRSLVEAYCLPDGKDRNVRLKEIALQNWNSRLVDLRDECATLLHCLAVDLVESDPWPGYESLLNAEDLAKLQSIVHEAPANLSIPYWELCARAAVRLLGVFKYSAARAEVEQLMSAILATKNENLFGLYGEGLHYLARCFGSAALPRLRETLMSPGILTRRVDGDAIKALGMVDDPAVGTLALEVARRDVATGSDRHSGFDLPKLLAKWHMNAGGETVLEGMRRRCFELDFKSYLALVPEAKASDLLSLVEVSSGCVDYLQELMEAIVSLKDPAGLQTVEWLARKENRDEFVRIAAENALRGKK